MEWQVSVADASATGPIATTRPMFIDLIVEPNGDKITMAMAVIGKKLLGVMETDGKRKGHGNRRRVRGSAIKVLVSAIRGSAHRVLVSAFCSISKRIGETKERDIPRPKGKESYGPVPPSTQWLAPPALPASVAPQPSSTLTAETLIPSLSSLPSMQPFPKPKDEDSELASLRIMYKELKDKPNLPEDIQKVVKNAETTLQMQSLTSN